MSNLRVQSILKTEVENACHKWSCGPSQAFIILLLSKLFKLDDFEAEDSITDGHNDKGIDAIFDQENIIYVVQGKYYSNYDKTLDENSKNKLVEAVSNLILNDYPIDYLNDRLRNKIEAYRMLIRKGEIEHIEMVFLTNGQKPNCNICFELDKFCEERDGQVSYKVFSEEDIFSLFLPASAQSVDKIQLKVVKDSGEGSKTSLKLPDIDSISGRVMKVDVVTLAEIVKKNPGIFNFNVRSFRTLRNKVNSQIASTLRDKELIKEFVYLNNGITIICDDYSIKPGGENFEIINPSIINGCQTASTIKEVFSEGGIEENTGFVLVRLVKTSNDIVKDNIIKSSNTQTAIKNRDLISEDQIHKELEKQFSHLGYYYNRKEGLYEGKPSNKIIDLEEAAQYYLALYLDKPADAKNKKSEIYKGYYEQIFNKSITAEKLLLGFILYNSFYQKVKEFRKDKNDEIRSILGNCVLHLLPLFKEWVLKDSQNVIEDYENQIEMIDGIVEQNFQNVITKLINRVKEIKKGEVDFNIQYFFKQSHSLNKILNRYEKEGVPLKLNKYNCNKFKDLRYYKPNYYCIDGKEKSKITHWNDLFLILIKLYGKKFPLVCGDLPFIDSKKRVLLVSSIKEEEKKIRKMVNNNLWLLTNFDSKSLSNFCFTLAEKLAIDLEIELRPTEYRKRRNIKNDI